MVQELNQEVSLLILRGGPLWLAALEFGKEFLILILRLLQDPQLHPHLTGSYPYAYPCEAVVTAQLPQSTKALTQQSKLRSGAGRAHHRWMLFIYLFIFLVIGIESRSFTLSYIPTPIYSLTKSC